jgi:ABC-type glycerol-3-phosphate transport system substrate-binding protein
MFRKTKFAAALATAAVAVTAFAGASDASSHSTVSILGTNGDYYGYVHSSDATNCEANRKVVVYKQLGSAQSPKTDQKIGTDTAEPNGPDAMWSIGNSGFKTGKFYAKAAKVPGFCKATTSATITR